MEIIIGDMFKSGCQTIINTVNCVGIMGKGIAAEFKKYYPDMFKDYELRCKNKEVKPGEPYLYRASFFESQIINFPTKSHWRAASRIEDIEKGLKIIAAKYKEWGITSLAVPPLGCGNGQLLWEKVGPLIYKYVKRMDIPVKIYAPYGTNPSELSEAFLSKECSLKSAGSGEKILQKINPSWIALLEIVYRIEKQKYHNPVGRTIFQKIAYVATELGLPTGLQYVRGSYGPYSKDIDNVKKRLSNAGLMRENKIGQMFQVIPGSEFENERKKYFEQIRKWDELIDKTADLFLRVDTERAEIAATVLFTEKTLNKNGDKSEKDIFDEVMKWKQKRRPPLKKADVAETIRDLGILKWFALKPSADLPLYKEWG